MIQIRPMDFGAPRDVDGLWAVDRELQALVWPDDPPRSRDALVRAHETLPAHAKVMRWLAWDGDRAVGVAHARWRDSVDNRHLAGCYVGVVPAHRRRGIGSRLIRELAMGVMEAGRTSVIFDSDSASPEGAIVLERLGGKKSYVARISRLDLTSLDGALMNAWIDSGEARSDEFEILLWDGRVPEEYLNAFSELQDVMNTAPFEDLDVEPFVISPEQIRASDDARAARGDDWWCAVARHRDTGKLAGFTDIHRLADRPTILYQGDTGIWNRYRGKGLGRWLKAVNALRAIRLAREARWIETGNAGSNRAMLAINEAMGFAPYKHMTAWQFDARLLADRTAGSVQTAGDPVG